MCILLAAGESLLNCLRVGCCHKVFKFSHLILLYNQDWGSHRPSSSRSRPGSNSLPVVDEVQDQKERHCSRDSSVEESLPWLDSQGILGHNSTQVCPPLRNRIEHTG